MLKIIGAGSQNHPFVHLAAPDDESFAGGSDVPKMLAKGIFLKGLPVFRDQVRHIN